MFILLRYRTLSGSYKTTVEKCTTDPIFYAQKFNDWSRMQLKKGLKEGEDFVLVSGSVWL